MPRFSTSRHIRASAVRGFTLVELLVVVAIIALLLAVLLPGLSGARAQARAVVCASNIRQLAIANTAYTADNEGRFCPGAAGIRVRNLHRWHGIRASKSQPFDPLRGPLVGYVSGQVAVRACPGFRRKVTGRTGAFESGCGGYGYNQAYVGRVMRPRRNGSWEILTDLYGVMSERVTRPAQTLMFADTAFASIADGVIEYSFAEPRFHPQYIHFNARMDPSIHFRHSGRSNTAWCDGHVDNRSRTYTWKSGVYVGDPEVWRIGWFGADDDNSLFDLN